MNKLQLSVAIGNYNRCLPLIDGVDPVFMTLSPGEIFFRQGRVPGHLRAPDLCR